MRAARKGRGERGGQGDTPPPPTSWGNPGGGRKGDGAALDTASPKLFIRSFARGPRLTGECKGPIPRFVLNPPLAWLALLP